MNEGRIIQVMGPVVDVVFEDGNLPFIKDALEVENNGKKCVMEVAQHLGNNEVRCLMLAASEGLHKDMEVTATGLSLIHILKRRNVKVSKHFGLVNFYLNLIFIFVQFIFVKIC